MISILEHSVEDIKIGTKFISLLGNIGEVVAIEENLRDCDGNYGLGWVIQYPNSRSWVAKSDIIFYKEKFSFAE